MTWFRSWTSRASSSLCCCSTPPSTRRCQPPPPRRPSSRPRTSVTNFLVSDTMSSVSPKPYPVVTPPRARPTLGPAPPSTGGWLEAEHVRVSPAVRHCRDTWPRPRCAPPSPESCSRDTAAPPTMSSGQHRSNLRHIFLSILYRINVANHCFRFIYNPRDGSQLRQSIKVKECVAEGERCSGCQGLETACRQQYSHHKYVDVWCTMYVQCFFGGLLV